MSNYVQTTFFTPKDSLPPTNPAKTIFGAAYDVEFGNIATAISTKLDSSTSFIVAVNGTANQITAANSSGTITLSLPSAVIIPGSLTIPTGSFASRGITDNATATAVTINSAGSVTASTTNGSLTVDSATGTNATLLFFSLAGAGKGRIGVEGTAGAVVTGSSAGDNLNYSTGGNWLWSTNGGASSAKLTSNGGLQLGAPTGGDQGLGTLNVATGISINAQPVYAGVPSGTSLTAGSATLVLSDANRQIQNLTGAARTATIPANASVAYPIGTLISFIMGSSGSMTIAITTDTLIFSPGGATGSRTLAANGQATANKIASTTWLIAGSGLT